MLGAFPSGRFRPDGKRGLTEMGLGSGDDMSMSLTRRTLVVAAANAPLLCLPLAWASPVNILGIWPDDRLTPEDWFDPASARGGQLRMGAVGTFDSFNAFAARGMSAGLLGLTYDSLGESPAGDDLLMRGFIAETFDVSDDRMSMTVVLREQAQFSDGYGVTAQDVVWSFKALMKDASPTYRSYYRDVVSVRALDNRTAKFDFKTADNRELPLIIAQMPVLPEHWWRGRNLGEPQKDPMPGTGPYVPVQYRMGQQLVLQRVKNWWGDRFEFCRGRWNFDTVRLEYYRDFTVMREAFFAGELDFYAERTIKDWKLGYDVPAVRDGRIQRAEIQTHSAFGMSGIFMNTRKPILADRRVREALTMLFDFEWVNHSIFFDAYDRCESFFTGTRFAASDPMTAQERVLLHSLPGLSRSDLQRMETLPVIAKALPRTKLRSALALMQDAGWQLRDGKLLNASGQALKLTLILSSPSMSRIFSRWSQDLSRLGITLELAIVDQTQYINRVRAGEYDLLLATIRQSANPGNEQQYFWGTKAAEEHGSRNYAGIRSSAVDALCTLISRPKSKTELNVAVRVLDRVLRCERYAIPGWYSQTARIAWWKDRIEPPYGKLPESRMIQVYAWHAGKNNRIPAEKTQ